MNVINVLWTGGLDSTYLVVKLVTTTSVDIQPYYILDEGRESAQKELNAIQQITEEIRKSEKVTAKLLDIKIVKKSSIKKDDTITASWQSLNSTYTLGSQYDFLSRFAKENQLKLAVGVLFSDRGKVARSIDGKAKLVEKPICNVPFLVVEGNKRNDTIDVFENLLFPAFMRNIEKTKEWSDLLDIGFSKIANLTWFCHYPVFGMPCGHCNPCKDALAEGMAFRVPFAGRYLYYIKKVCKKLTRH